MRGLDHVSPVSPLSWKEMIQDDSLERGAWPGHLACSCLMDTHFSDPSGFSGIWFLCAGSSAAISAWLSGRTGSGRVVVTWKTAWGSSAFICSWYFWISVFSDSRAASLASFSASKAATWRALAEGVGRAGVLIQEALEESAAVGAAGVERDRARRPPGRRERWVDAVRRDSTSMEADIMVACCLLYEWLGCSVFSCLAHNRAIEIIH